MSGRCAILVNDRAGALQATASIDHLRELIETLGIDAEVIGTKSAEDMCLRIRDLLSSGVRRIAVAGGDGTIHHAVQELAGKDVVLGIIPQGTANNFATALRIPQELPSALRTLQDGEVREVDLGCVRGEYFTEAAGVGMFADVLAIYGTGTNKDILRGIYSIGRVLLSFRPRRIRLWLDGELHSERAVMCTVANSFRMGMSAPMAPNAKVTDGKLDVVIVGDLTPGEYLSYYRALRAQTHLGLPKVSSLQARHVRIESRRPMNVHCDDHVIGATPVTITAVPRALKVLVAPL